MDPSQGTVILPGRSSLFFGVIFFLSGVALLGLSGFTAFQNVQGSMGATHYTWSAFLFVFGTLLLQTGRLVGSEKGGIYAHERILFLPGRTMVDRPNVSFDQISHLQAIRRVQIIDEDEIVRWELEIRLNDGASFLVAESNRFDDILAFGRHLSNLVGCAYEENAVFEIPEGQVISPLPRHIVRQTSGSETTYAFRVHRRWGLSAVLPPLGIISLWIGAMLMVHVQESPVAGFLFGPPLALLGLLILCVCLGKIFSRELFLMDASCIRHQVRVAGIRLSTRTLLRSEFSIAYTRIRPAGARGATLEVVGSSRSIPMANGTVASSLDLNHESLVFLCAQINSDLIRNQRSETVDPIPE